MASTILSDNGVSSGSAGLKSSADSTGALALQTTTAGGAATTAVTIDTSQNVGIGTASPNSRMSIAHSSTNTSVLGTYANIPLLLQNTSSTDNNWTVIGVQDASNDFSSFIGTQNTSQASNTAIMAFGTNGGSGATERMRIDSSGIVQIGGTSARTTQAKLELTSAANTALSFYMYKTSQVEVTMGFKSSADSNFYIGTGSTSVGTYGVYLTNTGSSWNAVSDERMKTIIEPIENAAEKVSSLRAVIGYYNNDESQTRRPFLIAQDVQDVLPEAVNIQDVETGTLGMSYTDTIPLLVAAIKEQQALITALTARITALEAQTADNPQQGETP